MIFCVIADILHVMKMIMICDLFFMFEKQKKENIVSVILWCLVVLGSVVIYGSDNGIFNLLIYFFTVYLLLKHIYKEKNTSIIIVILWMAFIVSLLDEISLVCVDLIGKLTKINCSEYRAVLASVITLIVIGIIGRMYNKKYEKSIRNIGILGIIGFTLIAIVDTIVIGVMSITTVYEYNGPNQKSLYIAFIGAILGIFIQLAAVILVSMQKNMYKEKEEVTRKYLNEQKSHYEYLENREQETKKFRHDLRNHMYMLSGFIKDKEYEKADEYIEKMDIKMESLGNVLTVNNGIVDAILNQYYSDAIKKGIRMNVKGKFPKDCNVDTYDLCTIFSNVLSNAVEAAQLSREKSIDIECRYTENLITVIAKNTYKNIGQFDSGKINTLKSDENYHGFGLGNIKDSIAKCKGMLDIEISKEVFMVKIMLRYAEKRNNANSYN